MTVAHPEVEQEVIESHDFDLPCDISKVWPELPIDHGPAEWIGYKACGHHRLLCNRCRDYYLAASEMTHSFICTACPKGEKKARNRWVRWERLVKS